MSLPITAILVDDELDSTQLLQLQLRRHCPNVNIIGIENDSEQALASIARLQPRLLFLDIEMPNLNGFQLLEKLLPFKPAVIFITAYNQYAIKAFKYNALDYLVKPVLATDLMEAVAKASNPANHPSDMQLKQAQQQMVGEPITKIAVSTQSGVSFITLSQIMYVEASSNYSLFIMDDCTKFTVSKTLKEVQELLEEGNFFRIHRQFIINLNKVKHFDRFEFTLTLDDKTRLPVSRSQKDKLLERYNGL